MRDTEREGESVLSNIQYGGRECESTCRSCKKLRDSRNIRNQADKEVREGTQDCRPYLSQTAEFPLLLIWLLPSAKNQRLPFPLNSNRFNKYISMTIVYEVHVSYEDLRISIISVMLSSIMLKERETEPWCLNPDRY